MPSKLMSGARQSNRETLKLSEEGICKHAILDTNPHELGWITVNRCKFDAMLSDPRLEFRVRGYLRP
jgi:hypothetical protein